jgi:hypothetical protein
MSGDLKENTRSGKGKYVILKRMDHAESIELFIEDQAFLPSYDLAPPTLPLPPPRQ